MAVSFLMFQVEMRGLTGVIKFDNQGFRSNFVLDIVELTKEGLTKIGTWNSTEGVNFTRTYGEVYTQIVESLQNKTFIVTTILVSTLQLLISCSISSLISVMIYFSLIFYTYNFDSDKNENLNIKLLKFGYILRKNVPIQDKTGRNRIGGLFTGNRIFLTIEEHVTEFGQL